MLLMTLLLSAASRSTTNSKPSLDTSVMYFPWSMIRVCVQKQQNKWQVEWQRAIQGSK